MLKYRIYNDIGYTETLIKPKSGDYETIEFEPVVEKEIDYTLISQARSLLAQSDMVAIRCLKANIPYPKEWFEYVNNLRDVINGNADVLPVQPDYPKGS